MERTEPGSDRPTPDARPSSFGTGGPDLARLAAALAPALLAIALLPGFVTQDGPAHVYNARILADALIRPDADSFPLTAFDVRLDPIPNWAGHVALIGLTEVLPARAADRVMMAATLAGVAVGVWWLIRRVGGGPAGWGGALLVALLALNLTWLFGFYGFLLGVIVGLATLGLWWGRRDRPGPGLAVRLAALVTVGYFCHPIGLAITIGALGVLALIAPGERRAARLGWTVVGLLPLVPLGLLYLRLMKGAAPANPQWGPLAGGFRPRALVDQALWVDPITIGRRTSLPFLTVESAWCGLLAPAAWLALALVLGVVASGRPRSSLRPIPGGNRMGARKGDRHAGRPSSQSPFLALMPMVPGNRLSTQHSALSTRGTWGVLAVLVLVAGFLAPDSLGESHGHYLPQRVVLMGLLLLAPAVAGGLGAKSRAGRAALGALAVALAVQSAWVWDYALRSDRIFRHYRRAIPAVGSMQRVAGLFLDLKGPHRANPLLHLDCLLGVGTGNVVWSNYEAAYYYFPVRLRDPAGSPPIREFERIGILDRPEDAPARRAAWRALLERHAGRIDAVVVWGEAPGFDEITSGAGYDRVLDEPPLAVWRRRVAAVE